MDEMPMVIPDSLMEVFRAVAIEREEQDAQWGVSNHDPVFWMAIIGKHVGRAHADTLNMLEMRGFDSEEMHHIYEFSHRLIVIAALCCAAAESMNRAEWSWG